MGASCRKLLSSNSLQAAGSVLDRVISQASSEDNTVLYKLADYKKGGLLLETYAKGGMLAAEKLIREEFSMYMYAGGKGRVINRAEYLRWKFRDQEQVVLPIEASLSPHDPLAKWEDHAACWQMCFRGALGESLLHVLIICDTKIHTRLARTLVKCYPKLSMDVVEGEEYLGASSLHLAIAYSNNELVQDLVEAGADVNQRAIGSFFLPRDQQYNPPARQTNYEGLAYLGEYPLAWTACCANESGYNLLIDSGADPDAQDSFGNMILHMVVVCDKLDMFGYALRHPKLPASNGRVNKAGFTPLTLACQLGRSSVFREMLELSAREFWRYSNITCSAYPLNALDTLLPDGRTNWNSALFIILNGTKQEHLNMLDGGIIQRLLEEKWKTFARTENTIIEEDVDNNTSYESVRYIDTPHEYKYSRKQKRKQVEPQPEFEFVTDPTSVTNQEFEAVGTNVSYKLRRMTDDQRYIAELLINKILICGLRSQLCDVSDLTGLITVQHCEAAEEEEREQAEVIN